MTEWVGGVMEWVSGVTGVGDGVGDGEGDGGGERKWLCGPFNVGVGKRELAKREIMC